MSTLAEPNLVVLVVIAVLVAGGVYLLLERSLSRVLIGIILLSNGANLFMLVVSGPPGGAPIVGLTPEEAMSDPLPQAMVLTAIVITLGMTAFLLAMAHRSWQLHQHDEVQDDEEDRRIARLAAIDLGVIPDRALPSTLDQEAAEARDETAEILEKPGDEGDAPG